MREIHPLIHLSLKPKGSGCELTVERAPTNPPLPTMLMSMERAWQFSRRFRQFPPVVRLGTIHKWMFFTSLQIHKTSFTELVSFRVTPYPPNVDIICEWHTGEKTKNPFPFTTKSSAAAQRALTFLPFLLCSWIFGSSFRGIWWN